MVTLHDQKQCPERFFTAKLKCELLTFTENSAPLLLTGNGTQTGVKFEILFCCSGSTFHWLSWKGHVLSFCIL